jgi:hypothetical protein
MKVSELITVLQKVDPDHEVIVHTGNKKIVPIIGIVVCMAARDKDHPDHIKGMIAINPEVDRKDQLVQKAIRKELYVEDSVSLEWNPDSKMPLVE